MKILVALRPRLDLFWIFNKYLKNHSFVTSARQPTGQFSCPEFQACLEHHMYLRHDILVFFDDGRKQRWPRPWNQIFT